MSLTAPAKKRAPHYLQVPPAGKHEGTLEGVTVAEDLYNFRWRFSAAHTGQKARTWRLDQEVDAEGAGEILVDLGLAGQTVEDLSTLAGKKCVLVVVTMGGHAWARIKDTEPLPAS